MTKKVALITGITGQDGSYLAEFLLDKNYEVHGLVRRVAFKDEYERFLRINHLLRDKKIKIYYGDVAEYATLWRLIAKIQPDEIYHLASQSHVKVSFEDEFGAFKTNTNSTHYLLSAIKELKPDCKFYFAGTSEMFGQAKISPQDENTPFNPVSPYGCAKLYAYNMTRAYRMAYGMFAANGILFNHESERRGVNFVTRKITRGAARIKLGLQDKLVLGNLDAKRDWGHSRDYMEAIYLIMQHDRPDDWVVATGEYHTVREFLMAVFDYFKLDWEKHVVIDKVYIRPNEVPALLGDATKIKKVLGWKPKISFKELVKLMCDSDFEKEKATLV